MPPILRTDSFHISEHLAAQNQFHLALGRTLGQWALIEERLSYGSKMRRGFHTKWRARCSSHPALLAHEPISSKPPSSTQRHSAIPPSNLSSQRQLSPANTAAFVTI